MYICSISTLSGAPTSPTRLSCQHCQGSWTYFDVRLRGGTPALDLEEYCISAEMLLQAANLCWRACPPALPASLPALTTLGALEECSISALPGLLAMYICSIFTLSGLPASPTKFPYQHCQGPWPAKVLVFRQPFWSCTLQYFCTFMPHGHAKCSGSDCQDTSPCQFAVYTALPSYPAKVRYF